MNSIPLVRNNSVNDINTSLIALRKVLRELTETTSDVNKEIEKYVLKSDVVNVVENGNDNPVTSGGVADALINYDKAELWENTLVSICPTLGAGQEKSYTINSTTILDLPVQSRGIVVSRANSLNNRVVQLYYCNQSTNNDIYYRYLEWTESVWSIAINWRRFTNSDDLNAHIGQNYCLIHNANGIDRYTTVRFSTTNWGVTSNDYYGIIMTYYNGEEYYINAKTGEAHPTDPFNTRTLFAYLYGIYVDLSNGILYIYHRGYRGFFIRFQGNLISIETSTTAPSGITFNNIVFSPNTTTREIKGGDEETEEEKPIEEKPKEKER